MRSSLFGGEAPRGRFRCQFRGWSQQRATDYRVLNDVARDERPDLAIDRLFDLFFRALLAALREHR